MSRSDAASRPLQDIATGACVALASGGLLIDAADLPDRSAMFPRAVLWCSLVVGGLLMLQGGAGALRGGGATLRPGSGAWLGAIAVPALVLIAGTAILLAVGFYAAAPVIIFTIYLWHRHLSVGDALSAAGLGAGALLAAIATAGMYAVFSMLIGLPAPSGAMF